MFIECDGELRTVRVGAIQLRGNIGVTGVKNLGALGRHRLIWGHTNREHELTGGHTARFLVGRGAHFRLQFHPVKTRFCERPAHVGVRVNR